MYEVLITVACGAFFGSLIGFVVGVYAAHRWRRPPPGVGCANCGYSFGFNVCIGPDEFLECPNCGKTVLSVLGGSTVYTFAATDDDGANISTISDHSLEEEDAD